MPKSQPQGLPKAYKPLRWLFLSALVLVLDFASKQAAIHMLVPYHPKPIFPGVNMMLAYNRGIAFSLMNTSQGWAQIGLTIMAVLLIIALFVWLNRLGRHQLWTAAGLALAIGGAIGNVCDRLTLGAVVDFIDVYFKNYHWPAFNVADSAITVGVVCLIIGWCVEKKA